MGKRGPKPKGKVKIEWSPNFAYAIGLLATDGCLCKDGIHIDLTSKDTEQLDNFTKSLDIKVKIGLKKSGHGKLSYRVQFGDVLFCKFLNSIGLMPNKSKILSAVGIPDKYFFDFFRGVFDGDGGVYSYFDSRWKSSFMFYTEIASASEKFILWLQEKIYSKLNIRGHITKGGPTSNCLQLKYAKKESLLIWKRMYRTKKALCLSRKKLKIQNILDIVNKQKSSVVLTKQCASGEMAYTQP